jgi:hypothetical protein
LEKFTKHKIVLIVDLYDARYSILWDTSKSFKNKIKQQQKDTKKKKKKERKKKRSLKSY